MLPLPRSRCPLHIVNCVLMLLLLSATPSMAAADPVKFQIPVGDAPDTLGDFGQQSGLQMLFEHRVVAGHHTRAVEGSYEPKAALSLLLDKSGLTFEFVNERTVTIRLTTIPRTSVRDPSGTNPMELAESNAAVDQSRTSPDISQNTQDAYSVSSNSEQPGLNEIIVTAQKRNERLEDVPVPVTVLDTDALSQHNQDRLQDYFATVPGLNLAQLGGGQQSIAIRGITTSVYANPTVGFTIDDVPYGSSADIAYGSLVLPDLDPGDLAGIEVLRGPQGTLYGASSMGGLVKFETKDPTMDRISGRVQVLGDQVERGQAGYGTRASINVPLSDSFAFRASGFVRRDPGYIDNVATGQTGVNRADVYGGQLVALWRPSDRLSLRLSALLQNTEGNGSSIIDTDVSLRPLFGDLNQARPHGEPYSAAVRLFSATLNIGLGGVDLTSVSGFGDNIYHQIVDSTGVYGSAAQTYFNVPDADYLNNFETRKFTQEFRLASPNGQTLEWLAGAFYTHEASAGDQAVVAVDTTTGRGAGTPIDFNFPTTVSEYALFGDLTVHFTDRIDVQVGGRESRNRQVYNETDTGPLTEPYFGAASPFVNATERTDENAFTYLLTPRFRISPNLMVYARLSSGYRVGGNNVNAVVAGLPSAFSPDKTNDYEFGVKGDLFDRSLTFDVSAYYIRWQDIQLSLISPATGFGYNANGGSAKSQGLEFSIQARPIPSLSIGAALTLSDAQLTQDFPSSATAVGFAGDSLPYSSRFSGSFTIDDEIPLAGHWKGFIGGALSYVGAREGEFVSVFTPTQPRFDYPAYADADIHAGARNEDWTINLFVNNGVNRRGIVGGGANSFTGGFDEIVIQPRTAGVSITRAF